MMLNDSSFKEAIKNLSGKKEEKPVTEEIIWVNTQILIRSDGTSKILKSFSKPVAKPRIKKKPEAVKFEIGGKEKIE